MFAKLCLVVLLSSCVFSYTLMLTIAYCPTDFTGKGAVVSVDVPSGNWKIVGKFDWPSDIFGCPALYDPTITFSNNNLFLMFGEDLGLSVILSLQKAKIIHTVKPKDPFFVGFVNMAFDGTYLLGEQPTGAQTGEFQFSSFHPIHGDVKELALIPFKAMMDDSHYVDPKTKTYYVQASYDQREQRCAPHDYDLCLLALNTDTGVIKSAIYTNYTVYKYAQKLSSDGSVLGFVQGYPQLCPKNQFLFARINLRNATATPIACLDQSITIQEEEWISSFSSDETLFATGSRFDGNTQLFVANTTSGAIVLDTKLAGLSSALGTTDKLFWIWSIDFLN